MSRRGRLGIALGAYALAQQQKGGSTRPADEVPISQPKTQWRNYPAMTITPERYWQIMRMADVGYLLDYMELLDDVAAHHQVGSLLETRKLAVAGAPLEVLPGDDTPLGQEIADHFKLFMSRIPRRNELFSSLLDSKYRSFAIVQPKWEALDAHDWQIVGHQAIEGRYCSIEDGQLLVQTLRAPAGEPVPEGFLVSTHQNIPGMLIRSGTGRTLSRLWLWASYVAIDAVSFLEKFGHPLLIAKTNFREGSTELQRVKEACSKLIVDQVGLLPMGADLEIKDTIQKSATIKDIYIAFLEWLERGMNKTHLGQSETSEMGSGGRARSIVSNELRQDRKDADASGLQDEWTAQVAAPWTRWHYGEGKPVPRIELCVSAPIDKKAEAEAKKAEAETDQILLNNGMELSKAELYDKYDRKMPVVESDKLRGAAPVAAPAQLDPTQIGNALRDRQGACPHCGGGFTLAAAEKKKRSQGSAM